MAAIERTTPRGTEGNEENAEHATDCSNGALAVVPVPEPDPSEASLLLCSVRLPSRE